MEYREDLKAYLDGELNGADAEEMQKALTSDADLAQEAAELQALSATLHALPKPQPYGMEQTLLALEAAKRPAARRSPWGWWLGLGLATAGCLAIGAMLFPSGRSADSMAFGESSRDLVAMRDTSEGAASSMPADSKASASAAMKEKAARFESRLDFEQTRAKKSDHQEAGKTKALAAPPAYAYAPRAGRSTPAAPNPTTEISETNPKEQAYDSTGLKKAEAPNSIPGFVSADAQLIKVDGLTSAKPFELKVASIQDAELALKEMAIAHEGVIVGVERDAEKKDEANRTLTLEVPEDQVEKVLAKLKDLPMKLAETKAKSNSQLRGQAGGRGGLGGGYGAQSGGPGGPGGQAGGGAGITQNQANGGPAPLNSQALDQNNRYAQSQSFQNKNGAQAENQSKNFDARTRENTQRKATRKISIVLVPIKGD